jgi:hypothetical protein
MMRPRTAILAGLCVLLASCTSYYSVRDTATGTVYYTTDLDRSRTGAVSFEDARTGSSITVQNSEVTEIGRGEYRRATGTR